MTAVGFEPILCSLCLCRPLQTTNLQLVGPPSQFDGQDFTAAGLLAVRAHHELRLTARGRNPRFLERATITEIADWWWQRGDSKARKDGLRLQDWGHQREQKG